MRIPTGRISTAQGLAALVLGAAALMPGAAAHAAAADEMLDHCRNRAAKRLDVSPDTINLIYEGKGEYGTHAINGSAESSPPVTFQCSFDADGERIVKFVVNKPEGCPPTMSESKRSNSADCR